MKFWKKASGAIKDQSSILIASFSPRTSLRNPEIESAVIRATSHDEHHVDYRNSDRVFRWIRLSPGTHLGPFAWALCIRVEKTRDWVVALKGLILMHGVLCCRVPTVQKIGRLPFDLSGFRDEHLSPVQARPFNSFVRSYYAFLDQKSAFFYSFIHDKPNEQSKGEKELVRLEKFQILLDMLLKIKPESVKFVRVLILEAMDCVIIEIFDIYNKICNGIAKVLPTIDLTNRSEALMSLKVLQKATEQGIKLTDYFDFCQKIGVMNASEKPQIPVIPANEIGELERVVNGYMADESEEEEDEKAVVLMVDDKQSGLDTVVVVVTDEWEVFEEEDDHDVVKKDVNGDQNQLGVIEPYCNDAKKPNEKMYHDLPDLITFL